MKTKYNIILIILLSTMALASCIKETFPEGDTATSDQIIASSTALDAAVTGISSQISLGYLVYDRQVTEIDMAYPGLMIAWNAQLGDMMPMIGGWDHYSSFNTNAASLNDNSYASYISWYTLYKFIKCYNDIIKTITAIPEHTDQHRGYLATAHTCRAWAYWHLWNMYVPVKNEYTVIPDNILNLTVPLVLHTTTEAEAMNNPRATVEDIYTQIMADLDIAEVTFATYTPNTKLFPNLSVVYGIKARAYLSKLDYPKAAEYARKAITASGATVLTQAQWEDPATGFNSATSQNSWMWHTSYVTETIKNLANFTGWMSGEATWSYGGNRASMGINRWLYDRLSNTDFRKYSFLDPKKDNFYDYKLSISKEALKKAKPYISFKFRPVGGNFASFTSGAASDVPLMRVEEMILIEAEALGVTSLSDGKDALEAFVKTRDLNYTVPATVTDVKSFQEEVIFHKRIELWGEGLAFFDAKRLELGAKQSYPGTNAVSDNYKINANGIKPSWNYVIPIEEVQSNIALTGMNNPDPSGKIQPVL